MRRWYANGDTKQWWKISKKNWTGGEKQRRWPPKKTGMTIGAAWKAQQSLDEEKEKGKKRKRYDTKEEAEAAARDDRDRDPDYVRSEEDSSVDPTYAPSRKELSRADEEGDK